MSPASRKATSLLDALAVTSDGVFVVDMEQRIVLMNDGAEQILGYAAADVRRRKCYMVFAGQGGNEEPFCQRDCPIVVAARAGESAPRRLLGIRTKAGKTQWVSMALLAASLGDKKPPSLIHVFHDATGEVEAKRVTGILARFAVQDPTRPQVVEAPAPSRTPHQPALTVQETRVLKLIGQGLTTQAMAAEMRLSEATVRSHVKSVLAKLGAHSRLQAVLAAKGLDLL